MLTIQGAYTLSMKSKTLVRSFANLQLHRVLPTPSTKISAMTCRGERLLRETDLLKVESSHLLSVSLQERRLGKKMALQTSLPARLAAPG